VEPPRDGPGPLAALGWIELAKEREHRERDLAGAWAATDEALLALYRSRGMGRRRCGAASRRTWRVAEPGWRAGSIARRSSSAEFPRSNTTARA